MVDALVVELSVSSSTVAAGAICSSFNFVAQLQVFAEESVASLPVAPSTSARRINSSRHSAGSIWL